MRLGANDATPGGWLSSTAYQTSLVRLVLPGWCPLRATINSGTPALTLPIGSPVDSTLTTTKGEAKFIVGPDTGSAIAHGFAASINEYLVDGATLTQIRGRWKTNPTHVALPLLMPRFGVLRVDFTNLSVALLSTGSGFAIDASADLEAYNAEHYITFTPDQNATINKTLYHYAIVGFNEGHTNALANGSFYSFELTQTPIDARRA